MQAISERLVQKGFLSTFTAPQLSDIAWAFAKLGIRNELLMQSIAEHAMRDACLSMFTSADIARICWAFAFLSISHDPLMAAIANLITCNEVLATFTPQDMTTVLWAFTVNNQNHQLSAAAVAAAQTYLSSNAGMVHTVTEPLSSPQSTEIFPAFSSELFLNPMVGTQL
jgi:hypothetical protein